MASRISTELSVALRGFSDREQKVLASAFKLSAARPQHYIPWEEGARPDVLVVNDDLLDGLGDWDDLQATWGGTIPVLRVGADARAATVFDGAPNVFVNRPVLAIRILNALDALVAESLARRDAHG